MSNKIDVEKLALETQATIEQCIGVERDFRYGFHSTEQLKQFAEAYHKAKCEQSEVAAYMHRSKMTDYAISLLPTKLARQGQIEKGWSEWKPVPLSHHALRTNVEKDWLNDHEFYALYTTPPDQTAEIEDLKEQLTIAYMAGGLDKNSEIERLKACYNQAGRTIQEQGREIERLKAREARLLEVLKEARSWLVSSPISTQHILTKLIKEIEVDK